MTQNEAKRKIQELVSKYEQVNSSIIIYQSPDGSTKLEVNIEDETVWLTQEQMATLFGKGKSTINEHILNVYAEGELEESDSKRKIGISDFSTVQNKMHYAVHGHTAAEIIASRSNAKKPLMGLTSFKGDYITPHDVHVAKNWTHENIEQKVNKYGSNLNKRRK